MDLPILDIFVRVMRRRSFAAVSRELGVAPSSVSRGVAALEEKLGVKLFVRSTRHVEPTEAALSYYEKVEPLLRELEQASIATSNLVAQPQGTLRITCPVSFAEPIITKMLPHFSASYPELAIDLIPSNTGHDLHAERIDLAIRYGQLRDSSLVATRLCALEETVCATPEYLKKMGRPTLPKDLQAHACLLFLLPNYASSWRFKKREGGADEVVPLQARLRCPQADVLKQCALNGMGITVLPSFSIEKEVAAKQLIPLLNDYEVTTTQFGASIWLVYPSREALPLRARVFIDVLRSFVAKAA